MISTSFNSHAQGFGHGKSCIDFFGLEEGLSQGFVSSMLQDREGFIWIGTKDGLNRYDGNDVKVYRHDSRDTSSLPDNYILSIGEDSRGNIWVTTQSQGISLFDKKTENFIPVASTLCRGNNRKTMRIAALQEHTLITAEAGDFVAYTLPEKSTSSAGFELSQGLSLGTLMRSAGINNAGSKTGLSAWKITSPDSIWYVAEDGLLLIHRDLSKQWHVQRRLMNFLRKDGGKLKSRYCLSDDFRTCLLLDDDKFTVVNVMTEEVVLQKPNRGAEALSSFVRCYPLNDGSFLLDDNDVLYRLPSQTLQLQSIGEKTVDWVLFKVILDRSGVIWCGTGGFGLLRLDTKRQHFQNSPSFANLAAHDTSIDHLNSNGIDPLYYLNSKRQLKRDDNRRFALLRNACNCIVNLKKAYDCRDSASSIAFFKQYIPYLHEHGYFPPHAGRVLTTYAMNGKNPKLWVLDRMHGNLLQSIPFPVTSYTRDYDFLSDAVEDANGDVWFATTQGLFLLDGSSFKWKAWTADSRVASDLQDAVLFSLCPDAQDPDRYLWMGSDGDGLFRLDKTKGQLRNFSMRDGLQNGVVYGLLPDKAGNLWMSSNKGIACLHILPGADSIQNIKFFNSKNGLVGDEFNRNEFFRSPTGKLYFGGVNGYTSFQPESILAVNSDQPVVLLDLFFENKRVDPKVNPLMLPMPIRYLHELQLPYEHRNFSIDFSKFDYSQFTSKHYRYRLEGLSDAWIDNGSKNSLSFTNLDPGSYRLSVNATSKEGVWSSEITRLDIVILPPWWATWWFRTIVVALFCAFVYSVYRYRIQQFQKINAIRVNISNDLHDEIGSTLSSIAIASTILQKRLAKSQDAGSNAILTQISENANRMMSSITDIVWTMNVRNDSYDKIIDRMRAYASELFDKQDIEVDFKISSALTGQQIDLYQRKNTYLIFKEALNNIAKYASAGQVWIEMEMDKKGDFVMRIRDDGVGFDTQEVEQSHSLSGNGLFSMKDRAKVMHGFLTVKSSCGQGTEVMLSYPL